LTLWLSALFLTSRVVVVLFLVGRMSDVTVHMKYVSRLIWNQELPYRDFIPEYPPLVVAFTSLPAAIDSSLRSYEALFRALCFLVDCGIWGLLLRQCTQGRIGPSRLVLYIFGTTALGALLYDRIDIVLGAMLLVAATALLDGRDRSFQLALGLGIAFKLIPVVVGPLALAIAWTKPGRRVGGALLRLTLPTVISFAAIAGLGGYRFDKMFEYHLRRGIQIESVPASFEMICMTLGMSGKVSWKFGCDQLTTSWARPLATTATVTLAMVVLGSALMVLRRKPDKEAQMLLFSAVLSGAMVCSKVLSPQYFLFLLPVLVVLPAASKRSTTLATWGSIVAIYGLTGVEFPWMYSALVRLGPWAEFLVIVRNVCLVALSIVLMRRAWKHPADSSVATLNTQLVAEETRRNRIEKPCPDFDVCAQLKAVLTSGNLLLAAYALLGTGLWISDGHYAPIAFGLLATSFTCVLVAFFRGEGREPGYLAMLACLGLFLLLNARTAPASSSTSVWFILAYQEFCASLLLMVAIVHLPVLRSARLVLARGILVVAALAGAILFRILTPVASPAPVIDVFSLGQESAQFLLAGKNPYVEEMRDVYEGRANFVISRHFTYPPANLFPLTLSYLAFGDVRYVSVAAELLVALVLYLLVRKQWPQETAQLLPLLFLFHPRGLFVVEQAWTETMLLAAFALFMLLQFQGRRTAAAAIYGYFLSLKQYLLFFVLHWFLVERNIWRLLLGISVAAATVVPFALWDFESFWEQGVLFNFTRTGFREDSLSISSALYPLIGPISKSLSVIVGALASAATFRAVRNEGLAGYSWAVTITTYAMFFFGSQAFCNYYYFVGGLLLFTMLQQPEPKPQSEGRPLINPGNEHERAP